MNSSTNNKEIKKYSLKSNFIFNFISQILVLIIPLITAPYIARVLGADINGQISFSSSIVTYFTLFASFGFATYGQREIARFRDDKHQRTLVYFEITFLRSIFTAVSIAVLLTITFLNVFDEKYKTFILIESINVLACGIDPSFFYQGVEDFKSIAIKTVLIKIVGLVFIFLFVKTSDDAWLYVLFNCGAAFISYLFMWPKVIKTSERFHLSELNLKKHLWPAFLIFLPSLATTIYSVLDKTMIGLLATNPDYENGCYEQAYKLNSILLLLISVISTIYIPRNAHEYAIGNIEGLKKNLKFSCEYVWLIGIPLIVGVAVLAPSLSYWFLGDGYDEVPLLLQIMSVRFLGAGFGLLFGSQLYTSIGKEKYATIATTIAAVVNFTMNIFFIKLWGATGASITTAISEVLVAVITGVICFKQKYLMFKDFLMTSIKKLIAAGVMFAPIYFMNKCFEYNIGTFLLITLVGCITYAILLLLLRDKFFIMILQKGLSSLKFKKKKKAENETE